MENNHQKFQVNKFNFQVGEHRNKSIIWIHFPYDVHLIKHLKMHTKPKWSRSNKKWYVTDNSHYRKLFQLQPKYFSLKSVRKISSENKKALQQFIDQLHLKGYSKNTIKTYTNEFLQLLKTLKNTPVNNLDAEKIRSYFLYCIKSLQKSESIIHSRINAVKFYFEQVLGREKVFYNIPRPKKPSTLPKALSTQDIKKMFSTIKNKKHQLLMKLCYGMGLRVSEVVNLKLSDIDSSRMQVHIQQAKGKKDRYAILPESVVDDLRNYCKIYQPKDYLFEGQNGGKYSTRSVQQVFKNAMKKAKINKKVGVHSLRHSYATHLIEQGTDIRFVQELLGHNKISTTMAYTQLTDPIKRKIKSPLDQL